MSNKDILSPLELEQIQKWLDENQSNLPEQILDMLRRMLKVYLGLSKSSKQAKQILTLLRQAMGIVPKSEKGRTEAEVAVQPDLSQMSTEQKAELLALQSKRDALTKERQVYQVKIRGLLPKAKNPKQLEFSFAQEQIFSTPSSDRNNLTSKDKVERMNNFGKEKGLHSTYESVKRVDLSINVTETTHEVETVTDFTTGKSVRAPMDHVGPEGFQITWRAIANLVKMHVGFAIPINRMAMLIGQPEFTSGKIYRIMQYVAQVLLPIYLCLPEELSDAAILSGDDTKTKVLELDEEPPAEKESISGLIDEQLGWAQPRADGNGDKKSLNVSLLIGRTNQKDPRSTIRFFRTHLGSVGNLLNKFLEYRNPKAGSLIFQGDLSTTNLPSEELSKRFELRVAGCGAHARRPFWRYRDEDGNFCYFMLRGFWLLSYIEKLIDSHGRSEKDILRYRKRYASKVWQALRNRSIAVTTGQSPGRFTYRKANSPQVWPPATELHKAAKYVINHFEELTLYISHAHLHYTNNGVERALRIEKCMLSGSKFRKTRNGRAVLDILRTINATCTAAKIEIADYIRYVYKHRQQMNENPQAFTPYAVALKLQQNSM